MGEVELAAGPQTTLALQRTLMIESRMGFSTSGEYGFRISVKPSCVATAALSL